MKESEVPEDSRGFPLMKGKVELPSAGIEKAEGGVSSDNRIRCSDLGMSYLRCLFYIYGHTDLELVSEI